MFRVQRLPGKAGTIQTPTEAVKVSADGVAVCRTPEAREVLCRLHGFSRAKAAPAPKPKPKAKSKPKAKAKAK